MSYPILEKYNRHGEYISFQKIAMPFIWSYLGTSETIMVLNDQDLLYDPLTNSHKYLITPLSYELFPYMDRENIVDPLELTATRSMIYAGYFIGAETHTVTGFIAEPDTLMVDTVNSIYFAFKQNDYQMVRAALHALKELQALYGVPIVLRAEQKMPASQVKPYEL